MNDELQKALAAILQKTTAAATAGVDFLSEQLPDVVRQLLVWHAVKSAVFCVLYLVLMAACIQAARRAWQAWMTFAYSEHNSGKELRFLGLVVAVLGVLFWAFSAADSLEWLQILLAPKLYLVEYTAAILKGSK